MDHVSKARQLSPGCFGAATVYGSDSQACKACPGYLDCGEVSIQTLQTIQATVDVRDLLARHKAARSKYLIEQQRPRTPDLVEPSPIPVGMAARIKLPVARVTSKEKVEFPISPQDQSALNMLEQRSAKTHKQALIMCKSNKINDMRALLPQGTNPFAAGGPQYMRVACDMVMNGGFTKAALKTQLMEQLQWGDGTAGPHVAWVSAILAVFGIVVGKSDAYVLNPALSGHN